MSMMVTETIDPLKKHLREPPVFFLIKIFVNTNVESITNYN